MDHVPPALSTATVLDATGAARVLSETWRERTAVLTFLRHYGCLFCREHLIEMARSIDAIRARGAELYGVGLGNVKHLGWFIEEVKPTFSVFTDPSTKVYEALEFKRGLGTVLRGDVLRRGVEAFREGHRQTSTKGNPWQQGGVVVVRPDGSVPYYYASGFAGDHPPVAEVLAAL